MNNKKNIERLFQEKFKDFEVEPPPRVWNNIESQLKRKKDRKIIPLWWKLSGIAAALILGSLISYSILYSDNQNNITNDKNNIKVVENNPSEKANNPVIVNKKIQKKSETINSAVVINTLDEKGNTVHSSEKKSNTNSTLKLNNSFNSNKNSVVSRLQKKYLKYTKERKSQEQTDIETVVETNNNNENNINSIAENKEVIQNPVAINTTNEVVKKDSIPVAAVAALIPNALEELLKEKQAKPTNNLPKAKLKKWQVSSNAAPIYSNSASQGSPLDVEFQNNSKDYKTNLGYGIGVKYALNKKFSIKTGANSVAMEYNTNDVLFSQESFSNSINNLRTNLEGEFLQIQTRSVSFANNETKFNGKLNQKMGYLEVPVELSYKLIDRKFGIDIIGGFSTLFLNENKVSLLSSGLDLNIGEANNLRQIHYSTNIGLGFKYNFLKSFQANFEPMFKYQINTFSSDNGNFKPYIFGLYTGVSYSF